MYASTVVGAVREIRLEIIEFISPGMALDITDQMETEFKRLGFTGDERIIGLEVNYKSNFEAKAHIKWRNYNINRKLEADPYGAYVYRYNQNLFMPTTLLPVYVKQKPQLTVSTKDHEFYLNSIILTVSDDKESFGFQHCSYKLDSVFGSQSPVTLKRYSYGNSNADASYKACKKAELACDERRYSKKLETCTKL
jgi:hypothetical protein